MTSFDAHWHWLDWGEPVDLIELCRIAAISPVDLTELVELGALVPLAEEPAPPLFPADCIGVLRQASKLRRDFDLDVCAMAVLMDQLRRVESLEQQLRSLRARLA
jgi:chaperone modulatory protein CbpM